MGASTIKEQTDTLRWALENTARSYEDAAAMYRRTQAALPDQPMNAPTAEAMHILARHGFVVMHRDQMDHAIGIVRLACAYEHESVDEADRLEQLLAYMKVQRHFAD